MLETEGRNGRLWLIDSSPDFLQTMTKLTLMSTEQADDEMQVKIITRFLDLIWPQAAKEVGYSFDKITGVLFIFGLILKVSFYVLRLEPTQRVAGKGRTR